MTPPSYKMGRCAYSRLNGVMIILQFLPRTISFTFISEVSNVYIFYKLSILEYGVCVCCFVCWHFPVLSLKRLITCNLSPPLSLLCV